MGKIIVPLKITNFVEKEHGIFCNALVDTGASHIVLPVAWKGRLGNFDDTRQIDASLANQATAKAELCGPVVAEIEGFPAIYTQVVFVDMEPEDGIFEPLIGYTAIELSFAGVDMVNHRLIRCPRMDLK